MRTEPTQENPLLKKKGIRRAGANNQVKIIPNLTFRFEKTFSGFHLMAITKKSKLKLMIVKTITFFVICRHSNTNKSINRNCHETND